MTHHHHQHKIERNLSFDPALAKPVFSLNRYENESVQARHFMKYFPKYLKNFSISAKTGPFKSKLKQTKIIRNFSANYSSSSKSEWRRFLSNKMKHIKTLRNGYQSPDQLVEKIKLFTRLTSIQFYLSPFLSRGKEANDFEKRNLIKACRKIQCLKSIKSLEFNHFSNPYKTLINYLDASPRLLRSLKTLAISCADSDEELLTTIKNSKNVLKYVTNLELASLCSPGLIKDFKSLENTCPNLTTLSFEFTNRIITYSQIKGRRFSRQFFPVEINYLNPLTTFNNLKGLCLRIADIFSFLNDFVSTPSIQNLVLNIEEYLTKEILLQIDNTFNDDQSSKFFKENSTLVKFYNNFRDLKNLETLKILVSQDCNFENYKYQNYLLQNILKTIPSLTNLTFIGCIGCPGLNPTSPSAPVRNSYLAQLLESCHHFSQTLHALEIGHENVIFSKFDLSSSRNKFNNLSSIKVIGKFDDSDVDISSSLEQIISLGSSVSTIKLSTFIDSTPKSLLSLLQQMNQLNKPSNLKLELQIKFFNPINSQQLEYDFEDIIRQLPEKQEEHPKLQGVSLHIFTNALYSSSREEIRKVLLAYGKKFDHFGFQSGSINF